MAARARVKVPESVAAGEVITIRSLIGHRMESGHREGDDGNLVPRDIIRRFTAAFDGEEFFSVDLEPAISANPYLEFPVRVDRAGTFTFTWTDDAGEVTTHAQDIALESR